jgi:hypothetical protein
MGEPRLQNLTEAVIGQARPDFAPCRVEAPGNHFEVQIDIVLGECRGREAECGENRHPAQHRHEDAPLCRAVVRR